MFTTYADVLAHLDRLGLFHMDFGLHRMRSALNKLGLLQPPCPIVQVLGTNGKGSTSTFLASLGKVHSLKTGLYTSPHFVSPEERIRIDGETVSRDLWPRLGNQIMAASDELTYFEFLTVLALLIFREQKTELIIMEAGLGGAHDATTAIFADALCYTPIGLDHTAILGDTLLEITSDKAGAIRGNVPVVTAKQEAEVIQQLRSTCRLHQAPLIETSDATLRETYSMELGLAGPHQRLNAATALTLWRVLHETYQLPYSMPAVRKGLAQAFLPGRLQQCASCCSLPAIWLDGAHNEHGLRALIAALHEAETRPSAVIFSCLQDKNWQDMCQQLLEAMDMDMPLIIPAIHNERAIDNTVLAEYLRELGAHNVQEVADISMAISLLDTISKQGTPVLICGSLYLLSEFYTLFPQYLRPARRQTRGY